MTVNHGIPATIQKFSERYTKGINI